MCKDTFSKLLFCNEITHVTRKVDVGCFSAIALYPLASMR